MNTITRSFEKWGKSAGTTYMWLRQRYHVPAKLAAHIADMQVRDLGKEYGGGLDCTPYRQWWFVSRAVNEFPDYYMSTHLIPQYLQTRYGCTKERGRVVKEILVFMVGSEE